MVTAEDAKAFGVEKMELEQIWPIADYITVHTPLIPQTRSKYCTFQKFGTKFFLFVLI